MLHKRRIFFGTIIIMLFLVVLSEANVISPVSKQAVMYDKQQNSGKVAVLLVDYAFLQDFENYPAIKGLLSKSSLTLVSNRLTGTPSMHKSRLTYASGRLMDIDAGMLNAGGSPDELNNYYVNTGTRVKPGTLTYLDIENLKNRNRNGSGSTCVGIIGDELHRNNRYTCVIGNSDGTRKDRSAVFMAMDSHGLVDFGNIDDILLTDRLFPGGRRTDYNKLAVLYKQYMPACSLMVIDTGDLSRLEQYKKLLSSQQYEKYKIITMKRIDILVSDILEYEPHSTLVIVSTYSPKPKEKERNGLSPVLVYDSGREGLLYSQSTRRSGIVTNLDYSQLLLEKLGLQHGNSIKELQLNNAYIHLKKQEQLQNRISTARPIVLKTYTVFVIFSLMLVLIMFLRSKYVQSRTLVRITKSILAFNMTMPLAFLLLPASIVPVPAVYILASFLPAALISILFVRLLPDSMECFMVISLATTVAIVADVLLGSPLMKQSVLGYDPIIGARFYGIGNEYSGVFIGSALILIGSATEKFLKSKKYRFINLYSIFVMLFLTGITGLPFWGANFGGALAAFTGFYYMHILAAGKKTGKRMIILLALMLLGLAAFITAIDLVNKDNYTHIGRLAMEIEEKGIVPLYAAIIRKAAMNIKLIKYTIWTKVLLCIIAAVTVLFFKPVGLLKSVFNRYSCMKKAWISISAASIVGFAVNDSGIVLASTAMIYLGCTLLYICLEQTDDA